MLKSIDAFLNTITMYRLVLYGLGGIAVCAFVGSLIGIISYSITSLAFLFLLTVPLAYGLNTVAARLLRIPVNPESSLITGLILFFVLFPPSTVEEAVVAVIGTTVAIASKYLLAPKKRHVFNPAACALVVIALAGRGEGIWWIGTPFLFPFVLVLGFLIVRKIERMTLFLAFLISATSVGVVHGLLVGSSLGDILSALFLAGPLVFFGTIMVTEPLTTPPTRRSHIFYGGLVGILTTLPYSLGPLTQSPELALLIGNIFSYAVSSKQKFLARLIRIEEVAEGTFDILCEVGEYARFKPGQYAECTLPHSHTDSRGSRRYFTIASAPHSTHIRFGIRYDKEHASSFKHALMSRTEGDVLSIGGISGSFTLPPQKERKVLLIAGGIGVTPFRSMVEDLLCTKTKRDIVLLYANKTPAGIAYRELFEEARAWGIRTEYIVNEPHDGWTGGVGFITNEYLNSVVPDLHERLVYISGPHAMVEAIVKTLREAQVEEKHIRTDFFPGYV